MLVEHVKDNYYARFHNPSCPKMGNFRVVQFSRYFAVSREPRKFKSAKYFPSVIICLLPVYRTIIVYSFVFQSPFFID